ncbi:hypothetical protein Pyrfu_0661 [Pyrolobus fumarii 1A]|uniref:Uncharacterized protein n=1 Tax=Pyrolobus fumarii (strain DSM 11204 / 1A) TaxID=694429 RepID=G0EHF5_PYRF1|nr:hypothetical protein [Pyrolobus fumarii]AEM38530.1 hypothetical protein Pyrfu_0661 [Pyrolobus fumarii 1A]
MFVRCISPIVASIIIISVTIAIAIAVAGFAFNIFTGYQEKGEVLRVIDAYFYYTRERVNTICTEPPCGFLIARILVESGHPTVLEFTLNDLTYKPSSCIWYTSSSYTLDPGDNIVVLTKRLCIVVSKYADPNRYNLLYKLMYSVQSTSQLPTTLRILLINYLTIHTDNPTQQHFSMLTSNAVYRYIVPGRNVELS